MGGPPTFKGKFRFSQISSFGEIAENMWGKRYTSAHRGVEPL